MWLSILLCFVGGVVATNGIPHFVRGITKQSYPCVLGNGPVPNLLAGWLSFVVAGVVFWFTDIPGSPVWSFAAIAVGVLAMGLFHAGPGAFGRPEKGD